MATEDALLLPFSAIVQILAHFPGGAVTQSSGFLAEPGLVVTVAHALYDPKLGKAVEAIVAPGCLFAKSGWELSDRSVFVVPGQHFRVHEDWRPRGGKEPPVAIDYGAILMPEAALLLEPCGRLGLEAAGDARLESQRRQGATRLRVSGYPAKKSGQWSARGVLRSFREKTIGHLIDTTKGQSGSPLVEIVSGAVDGRLRAVAIGVHSRGSSDETYNEAARVDDDFIRRVNGWKVELARLRGSSTAAARPAN